MQCSSAVLTMNWQEQKRFFFRQQCLEVCKLEVGAQWLNSPNLVQKYEALFHSKYCISTNNFGSNFSFMKVSKISFSLCKVQRAEDTCHVMSKTLHLCWEHLNFRAVFEAAEELLRKAKKKCGDTEKNKEKLEANCTGFSAEFFGSQSVEMFCFARKTKIQMLSTSCRS